MGLKDGQRQRPPVVPELSLGEELQQQLFTVVELKTANGEKL
jgi:hypothetical protein